MPITRVAKCIDLCKLLLNKLPKVAPVRLPLLLKLVYERYVWQWPLDVLVCYPKTVKHQTFLRALVHLRQQILHYDSRGVAMTIHKMTVRQKRLVKTLLLLHRRAFQIKFVYDMDPRVLSKLSSSRNSPDEEWKLYVAHHTSVIQCRHCYAVLTCLNIKNRAPRYVYYLHEDTLEPRCGRCHSSRLVKRPLFDPRHGVACYIEQPDFPTIRVCRGGNNPECYNLTALDSGLCGPCSSSIPVDKQINQ